MARRTLGFTNNIGIIILAVFLILWGLVTLFALNVPMVILAILALAAGILLLIGR